MTPLTPAQRQEIEERRKAASQGIQIHGSSAAFLAVVPLLEDIPALLASDAAREGRITLLESELTECQQAMSKSHFKIVDLEAEVERLRGIVSVIADQKIPEEMTHMFASERRYIRDLKTLIELAQEALSPSASE